MNHLTKKYERSMYMADVLPEFREAEIAKAQAKSRLKTHTDISPNPSLSPWHALIDMNSYFATLEQQANPFLRNRPVGIVKDVGRTCIIAASKEAKKLGIKSPCTIREAKQIAPNIAIVAADFDKYFYMTKVLKEIFESLSPEVDVFSLDEAFINLTNCRSLYQTSENFFKTARQKVHRELGEWVSFSLGLGQNRLQAKLASDFSEPDNWFEITPENLNSCLAEAKVSDICGIGYRLTSRLHQLNIQHPFQINFYDDSFLLQHFGKFWGPELRRIGQGKNSHLLDLVDKPLTHMKSVGRSKTLFKANSNPTYIRQLIYNLAEDVCFKARRMKLAGQHVYLSLSDTDGNWMGNELRFHTYICHTTEVFGFLDQIFHSLKMKMKAPIIKVSVRLGNLKPLTEIPICWLPQWDKQQKVFAGIDKVNQKYGLYTVKSASLVGFKILMPEVTGFLGDKTYQFGEYLA
jgi:DNA polymerase IV